MVAVVVLVLVLVGEQELSGPGKLTLSFIVRATRLVIDKPHHEKALAAPAPLSPGTGFGCRTLENIDDIKG